MSDQIDDGGPAFPASDRIDPAPQMGGGWSIKSEQHGMSLRDYFAAKAMPILINLLRREDKDDGYLIVSVIAYKFADAMLKARKA